MSNVAVTWAYRQPIMSGAKFTLVALADMADEAHSCFPGQARLATMTGQSERTVRRQLAELELAGYIVRARRFNSLGHRTSDRYVLPVDADVLNPTGQANQRSSIPAVNGATGQSGLRSVEVRPTGQDVQVSLREPPVFPLTPASGGRRGRCKRHRRYDASCPDCRKANEPPPKEKPPWCGECDPESRHIHYEDPPRSIRCSKCHSLAVVAGGV